MTVIPVSHFFNDSQFPEYLREYIFAEFEACGARHLTVHNLWAEQMMADSGKLSFYRHLGERHHISFIDSHAPWGGDEKWDLNVRDESRRPEMIRQHQHCMRILASLGIRTYTMHIGAQPCTERRWFGQEKQLRELVCRTLDQLLPVAEKENMTIALENCFEPSNTPEELLGYLKKFDSPYLGCCFDAGHATLMDRAQPRRIEDIEEYIRRVSWDGKIKLQNQALETLAPWIVTAHLHDNNACNDAHRLIFEGVTDWQKCIGRLRCCPRLVSIQNEANMVGHMIPIARACQAFQRLLAS